MHYLTVSALSCRVVRSLNQEIHFYRQFPARLAIFNQSAFKGKNMFKAIKAVAPVVANSPAADFVELTDMKELNEVSGGADITIGISITIKF